MLLKCSIFRKFLAILEKGNPKVDIIIPNQIVEAVKVICVGVIMSP